MNSDLSRRDFLRKLTVVSSSVIIAPLALKRAFAASGEYLPAGNVNDFTPGVYRLVTLSNGVVVQVRRLAGRELRFEALSAHCTHKGCIVAWEPKAKQFHCPCHGGRYDADGKNIFGPPPSPLPKLAAKAVKGIVMVRAS